MTGQTARAAAQDTINAVMADPAGPYFNPRDPRHGRAVEEMSKLFKIISAPAADNSTPTAADDAKARINAVYDDPNHPYHDSAHPDHGLARAEVPKLFETAYPNDPPKTAP